MRVEAHDLKDQSFRGLLNEIKEHQDKEAPKLLKLRLMDASEIYGDVVHVGEDYIEFATKDTYATQGGKILYIPLNVIVWLSIE